MDGDGGLHPVLERDHRARVVQFMKGRGSRRGNVPGRIGGMMEQTLYFYRLAKQAREKWSAARSAWFILIASAFLWGAIIALVWRFL
jgi:hypothetical protein